jgi:hypothetical protein
MAHPPDPTRETVRFTAAPIGVEWDSPPALNRKPTPPDRIVWADETIAVACVDWGFDSSTLSSRLRTASLARQTHATRSGSGRGSLGVGRYTYWFVEKLDQRAPDSPAEWATERIFEVYFDRKPTKASPGGSWVLRRVLRVRPS